MSELNVALGDSHAVVLPIAADCIIAIGPSDKDDHLSPEAAELHNRLQVITADEYVYYRPRQQPESVRGIGPQQLNGVRPPACSASEAPVPPRSDRPARHLRPRLSGEVQRTYHDFMLPDVEFVIRRFWAPLGHGHGVVDADGFLSDPNNPFAGSSVDAVTDEELRRCRSVVLLGEPGMGKSTFLAGTSPLLPEGYDAVVVDDNLAQFGSEDRLVRTVFESKAVERWLNGDGELCLTLDAFDDAQTRIPQLGSLVAEVLKGWPVDRLWLRIACRTSDWPQSLAAELPRLTPELTVVELLPLRRRDVASLAVEHTVDPELFLTAVQARGVGALAARPLTLKFLLGTFAKDNRLPERASDLYRERLLALCDEQNAERRAAAPRSVSPSELYAVARRVGAVSVFSGATAVWLGPYPCPTGNDLIAVDDLTEGAEPTVGGEVAVTQSLVREVTRTPLFSGRGADQRGWAHTSFQDFLAADWLLANNLSHHQLRSLLLADDGGVRPQIRRVAAWAVALAPGHLGWLAEADPESFVGEVDVPDPGSRQVLVDQLLAAAGREELLDGLFTRYSGLAHPGLANQLKPVLAESNPARWLAIRLADDCAVTECDQALAAVALDAQAATSERVAAGWALGSRHYAGDRLLPLVHDETLRQRDDRHDLLGVGLIASWPHALSTTQALDVLAVPAKRRHGGPYDVFVRELTKALTFDDLAAAAAWLMKTLDVENDSALAHIRNACLKLCANHLDDPAAAAAAVATAKAQLLRHDRILTDNESFPSHVRRQLALRIISTADADTDADLLSILDCIPDALLSSDDFLWLLTHAEAADPEEKTAVHKLLPLLVDDTRLDHANAVLNLDHDSPLRPVFDQWLGTCDLTHPDIVKLRARRQRIRERQARRTNTHDDIADRIDTHLDQFESGDVSGYWLAARLVCVRPGTNYFDNEYQPDLTAHPRWEHLTSMVRDRLVALAPRYLTEGRCAPENWLGQERRSFPAEAAYRALLLLLRHDPTALDTLPQETWQEWAPIIIAWPTTANGAQARDKERLLRCALPHARKQLRAALLAVIDESIHTGTFRPTRTEADLLWDNHLQEELTRRLTGDVPDDVRAELATTLLRNAPTVAESLLVSWLGWTPERSNLAAALLLTHRATPTWPAIHDWLNAHHDDADKVILELAHGNTGPPDLPINALAELYLWLWNRFPPDEDPHEDGTHWISPRESVGTFRNRILERLHQAGTDESLAAIRRIMNTHPEATWLKRVYTAARRAHRHATWQPTSPTELRLLAHNHRRRLIHTEKELLDAITEALSTIQQRLTGETPEAHLLWDTSAQRPKAEDEISDYLRNRLNDEVGGRRAVVNREVHVRRNTPTGIGERTDLQIDAFDPNDKVITAVIEVKTAWNDEVSTALPSQLVGQYMLDIDTTAGIFLVLWPDIESWKNPSSNVRRALLDNSTTLRELLATQAREQAAHGRDVRVIHLNISYRRAKNNRAGRSNTK